MPAYDYLIGNESSTDALTTEGGDGLLIFSLPSSDAISYSLAVDWDDDGVLGGDNEADYILKWAADRGRERAIGAPGEGFEPYRVGTLLLELDNSSGRYNPWNTDSALYGNLTPGKLMQMKCAVHASTSATGYQIYHIFTGITSALDQEGWNTRATLTCEDGLGMLDKQEINMKANYGLSGIFETMELYYTMSEYPYGYDFSTDDPSTNSLATIAYIYNNTYLNEFQMLCEASLGSFACEGNGTLAYHSIYESDAAITTLTDDLVLDDPVLPLPWENIRNKIQITADVIYGYINAYYAYPGHNEFKVTSGSGFLDFPADYFWYPLFAYYENADGSPMFESDIWAWSTYTSDVAAEAHYVSGSTFSTDLVPSTNYQINVSDIRLDKSKLAFINFTTDDFYITTLSHGQGGYKLTGSELFESGSTGDSWDVQSFIVDDSTYNLIAFNFYNYGRVEYTTNTENARTRIDTFANLLHNYLSTARVHPVLQMVQRPLTQFLLDVEKKVTYQSDTLNINEDFRICGIKHESQDGVQDILTTVYLYPVIPSST